MPTVGPATATTVYVPPAPAAARHEMLEAGTQETLAHADAPVSTAMALSAKFSPSSVSDTPPVFGAFLGAMCVTSGAAGRPSETSPEHVCSHWPARVRVQQGRACVHVQGARTVEAEQWVGGADRIAHCQDHTAPPRGGRRRREALHRRPRRPNGRRAQRTCDRGRRRQVHGAEPDAQKTEGRAAVARRVRWSQLRRHRSCTDGPKHAHVSRSAKGQRHEAKGQETKGEEMALVRKAGRL